MNDVSALHKAKRIGTGLSFIVFPLVFIFAFASHPDLPSPALLGPEEMIVRARNGDVLQFGHVLVTLNTALLSINHTRNMRTQQ
jgi:hypothetical protein